MRVIISFIAFSCLILVVNKNAVGQAAAEAALTHGLSSSAGTSLGKAMGNATGQLAGKLGQQTSSAVTHPRLSTTKLGGSATVKTVTAPNAGPSASGSLIASIQGSASPLTNCAPVKPTDGNSPKTDSAAAESHPAPANCAPSSSQDSETHPAVLNLPAAK